MQRSAILTASLLSALGLVYVGCTQDFNQFEPTATGGPGSSVSASSGGNVGGGGAGGAGGTGGQGGQGGVGGGVGGGAVTSSSATGGGTCMKPSDCGMDTACKTWTCKMGMCTATTVAPGTPTTDPTPGDCSTLACNANGDEVPAINNADKPNDMNPCTTDSCSQDGMPVYTPTPGVNCTLQGGGAGKCNAMGMCVSPNGCAVDADCMGLNAVCMNGACIACDDNMKNGDETGVDCGGTYCKDCNGDGCQVGADCKSGFCADGFCCNTACGATCMSCGNPGSLGTCSNVPALGEDPNGQIACAGMVACDGAGGCKLKNGQPCNGNNQCLSGKCGGNPKTCQP